MSRTLSEILELIAEGGMPEADEMRCALRVQEMLFSLDNSALIRLAQGKGAAKQVYEEFFHRHKNAGQHPPRAYLGENHNPDNPTVQARRKSAKRLMESLYAQHSPTPKPGEPGSS